MLEKAVSETASRSSNSLLQFSATGMLGFAKYGRLGLPLGNLFEPKMAGHLYIIQEPVSHRWQRGIERGIVTLLDFPQSGKGRFNTL